MDPMGKVMFQLKFSRAAPTMSQFPWALWSHDTWQRAVVQSMLKSTPCFSIWVGACWGSLAMVLGVIWTSDVHAIELINNNCLVYN